jgi:hypothetical protein
LSEHSEPQHDDGTADGSDTSASTVAAVGITVLLLMVVLAVAAVVLFDAEDDDVLVDAPVTPPTTMLPSEPEPAEPSTPVGTDSPLVGLTEAEVRELYPLVRVVEVDGEPLMATMDLQPGRINLALADGVVVGASTEGCEEAGDQDPEWLRQSCDPDPDTDGPNATGKLLAGETGLSFDGDGRLRLIPAKETNSQ